MESYRIALDLTRGEKTFRSETVVRFACAEPGAASFADLLAPEVHSVTLNGRELDPASVFDGARIALDGLAAENELRVVASCAYSHTGQGLHRFEDPADGKVYTYALEPADARRLYANFEQPDLKALSRSRSWHRSTGPSSRTPRRPGRELRRAAHDGQADLEPTLPGSPPATHRDRRRRLTTSCGTCTKAMGSPSRSGCCAGPRRAEQPDCRKAVPGRPRAWSRKVPSTAPTGSRSTTRSASTPTRCSCRSGNIGADGEPGPVPPSVTSTCVPVEGHRSRLRRPRQHRPPSRWQHMWFGDLVTMRWWDDPVAHGSPSPTTWAPPPSPRRPTSPDSVG
ncbi:hypothetical protein ACU686_24100, partial [Yinghuangia aomiensis]